MSHQHVPEYCECQIIELHKRIAELEAEVAILRDKLDQADIGNASLENEALCLMRWYDTARELLIRAHCQKIDSFLRADIKNHLEGKS